MVLLDLLTEAGAVAELTLSLSLVQSTEELCAVPQRASWIMGMIRNLCRSFLERLHSFP